MAKQVKRSRAQQMAARKAARVAAMRKAAHCARLPVRHVLTFLDLMSEYGMALEQEDRPLTPAELRGRLESVDASNTDIERALRLYTEAAQRKLARRIKETHMCVEA
jgi:hypothetical protein